MSNDLRDRIREREAAKAPPADRPAPRRGRRAAAPVEEPPVEQDAPAEEPAE